MNLEFSHSHVLNGALAATIALSSPSDHSGNRAVSSSPLGEGQMHISRGAYARRIRGNSRNVLWSTTDVAAKVKDIGHATYEGDQSKAKAFADDAGSSPRAAENWLAGDNPMSLTAFLNAYHNNQTFKAWARKILLMEQEVDPEFQAQLAAFVAAVRKAP